VLWRCQGHVLQFYKIGLIYRFILTILIAANRIYVSETNLRRLNVITYIEHYSSRSLCHRHTFWHFKPISPKCAPKWRHITKDEWLTWVARDKECNTIPLAVRVRSWRLTRDARYKGCNIIPLAVRVRYKQMAAYAIAAFLRLTRGDGRAPGGQCCNYPDTHPRRGIMGVGGRTLYNINKQGSCLWSTLAKQFGCQHV
jgi:hypothetical protein